MFYNQSQNMLSNLILFTPTTSLPQIFSFFLIFILSSSPCLHLSLDSAPPLCHLIGSLLVALQLWAAVWVEPAELRPHLFGSIYFRQQRLEDVLLLGKLSLPLLEKDKPKDAEQLLQSNSFKTFLFSLPYSECVPYP